ncbi:hypothetical protein [Aureimonas sp. ME7]|uniref:hypothetical protein n=1 Tax=Aureimonas sp. ME7 TaxID=2744252 RepID=UPI0015F62BBB|nr:hypothetical protein [Aureimonas sp. ME7]
MTVSCVVEICDGDAASPSTLLRFRSLPRVGETIVVDPGNAQSRTGTVRAVIHSPAQDGIEGIIRLEVVLS